MPAFLTSGCSMKPAVEGRGLTREVRLLWLSRSSCFRATTSSQRGVREEGKEEEEEEDVPEDSS